MPLDKVNLQAAILDILSSPEGTPDDAAEKLATAINTYVKTGAVAPGGGPVT